MGLTKQYLTYRPIDNFNIITSSRANINFIVYNNIEGRYAASAAAENVIIWDLRLGERVSTLHREKIEVTALCASPDRFHIGVGYADGTVQIFGLYSSTQPLCNLLLHKAAISVLRYDEKGLRLVTGSLDTELTVIDIIEQAGKQRLIGHNGPITDAHFIQRLVEKNIVVSCSKDTQIRFWNLETEFCFKTIVDNRTEVWALAFVGNLMVAGTSETDMNVYRLKARPSDEPQPIEAAVEALSIAGDNTMGPISVTKSGFIQRAGKGRTVNLITDPTERILSCHGTNDLIENFFIYTEEETKKRLTKRLKKIRKGMNISQEVQKFDTDSGEISLSDTIKRLECIRVKQKIKSVDTLLGAQNELRVLVSLANNSLQLYKVDVVNLNYSQNNAGSVKLLRSLTRMGHQSEVRSVCFTSDSLAIGSGSAESFKFWNRQSLQCLRTVSTDYILCCTFVPGNRYILLGMKSGKLLICDMGTGDILEEIPAHENELWSIHLLPNQRGCVSGSSDTTIKIWFFEFINYPKSNETKKSEGSEEDVSSRENQIFFVGKSKTLSLLHKNTLKLDESVLCVRISPDMKYLAVGLLDSTVKIFFLDSLKFYLSLYGHKLPILCTDISYDSQLIATGSADRNVRIWGMDFGNCHRSLFAHDDSVMALQFIPNTHMFFTCGRDGQIKQWDADIFVKIITLPGHIGEAYNLAVSPNGRFLVSCGSDRTMRLFERTEEVIVLQDVEEEEREEIENHQLATGGDSTIQILPGLKLASRKTVSAEKSAESILECLEICKQQESSSTTKLEPHPLMVASNATTTHSFLLNILSRIRASDLEEALLLLPFSNVCKLLERIPTIIAQHSDDIELLVKVTTFLFKVHMKLVTSTKSLKPLLKPLINALKHDIGAVRDTIGFNLHGLALLQHENEAREGIEMFYDATQERKKRRDATKRLFIQMS